MAIRVGVTSEYTSKIYLKFPTIQSMDLFMGNITFENKYQATYFMKERYFLCFGSVFLAQSQQNCSFIKYTTLRDISSIIVYWKPYLKENHLKSRSHQNIKCSYITHSEIIIILYLMHRQNFMIFLHCSFPQSHNK